MVQSIEKSRAIKFLPSDAVTKAYTENSHNSTLINYDGNQFAQTREWGLWDMPQFDYPGTVNGEPETAYYYDSEGVYCAVERSVTFWS